MICKIAGSASLGSNPKRWMAMKLTAIIDAVATVRMDSCPLSLQGHDHDRRQALGRAAAGGRRLIRRP